MGHGTWLKGLARAVRWRLKGPSDAFHSDEYLRMNLRRLEHLATLGLPLSQRSVFEVGAGIGDHTSFFLDRGCRVTTSDGREANVKLLRRRYPNLRVLKLDLDQPGDFAEEADVVHFYGLLYHLANPEGALAALQRSCRHLLLLETCVSLGRDSRLLFEDEQAESPSQALRGLGCRPTRLWVFEQLQARFAHVYTPRTQPWHEQFPIDWTVSEADDLTRAIFVASTAPLDNDLLVDGLLDYQERA